MIAANELRTGNCVVYNNEIMTIGELFDIDKKDYDPEGKGVHLLHLNGNRYDEDLGRSTGDLNPLTIERKYLLRMRFEQMGESHYMLNGFMVNLQDEHPSFVYGDNKIEGVTGFHQLQNHYADFVGKALPYDFKDI